MTKARRIRRYLRWHHARLTDGQVRLVFLPGDDRFTAIKREGNHLLVQGEFLADPLAWVRVRIDR